MTNRGTVFDTALVRSRLTRVVRSLLEADVSRFDAVFLVAFLLGRYWRRATNIPLADFGEPPPDIVLAIGQASESIVAEVYDGPA